MSPIGVKNRRITYNRNERKVSDCGAEKSPEIGACCVGENCFPGLTQAECLAMRGEWLGAGTNCGPPNPCSLPCDPPFCNDPAQWSTCPDTLHGTVTVAHNGACVPGHSFLIASYMECIMERVSPTLWRFRDAIFASSFGSLVALEYPDAPTQCPWGILVPPNPLSLTMSVSCASFPPDPPRWQVSCELPWITFDAFGCTSSQSSGQGFGAGSAVIQCGGDCPVGLSVSQTGGPQLTDIAFICPDLVLSLSGTIS